MHFQDPGHLTVSAYFDEEFWWLKALALPLKGYVGVARSLWTPPDENPCWKEYPNRIALDKLPEWAARFRWENVHRTLAVWETSNGSSGIVGPFVIDIDGRECTAGQDGSLPEGELLRTKELTIRIVHHYLSKGLPKEDLRVYFSSGPHHQDSGEAKIRESTAGVSRKPSSDCKACGCSSKHLCGLTAWNT